MDPRISFSNFVDAQLAIKNEKNNNIYREAPVSSSDFEFSVKNYSMISADEVFFKGMLLPQQCSNKKMVTLRDELLVNDEYDDDEDNNNKVMPPRIPKTASSRWKERLGLTRRGASKKDNKNKNNSSEEKRSTPFDGDHSPEFYYEECLSSGGK
ncbi:hypothetical protein PIB30_075541 [Stylosanthes scabra]|uniref:Uncharacterized protein n=1 Tax=Stylosanthes scabra TaxID=79078 RepID=A0ABU6WR88_9FABA|nr:hypothetical protein [Stylosanthes scabra]